MLRRKKVWCGVKKGEEAQRHRVTVVVLEFNLLQYV